MIAVWLTLALAIVPGRPGERPAWRAHDEVLLSPELRETIGKIAAIYHAKTKRTLEITSGVRTPERQAAAMYDKLRAGGSLALYKRQSLVAPISKAYREGRRKKQPRAVVVAAMAEVIRGQVERGEFISRHLKGRAFDARSAGLSGKQRGAFLAACREVGGVRVIVESRPPHFHVELLPPKPPPPTAEEPPEATTPETAPPEPPPEDDEPDLEDEPAPR
ncbi:MAG: hypothetical protein IT385_13910 [Deltaproteobacteria bacterium]|nr:hypothetical protein [Deltaproteobacteria bacterium]